MSKQPDLEVESVEIARARRGENDTFQQLSKVNLSGTYLDVDSKINFLSYCSLASSPTVLAQYRILRQHGGIDEGVCLIAPTTNRAITSQIFDIGQGYLLSLEILGLATNVHHGEVYCRAFVLNTKDNNATQCLCYGYVTNMDTIHYPDGHHVGSTEGQGILKSITGTDPAAGVEISEAVPTNARWRVRGFRFSLVTDATVQTRRVKLIITDGTTTFYEIDSAVTQIASLTNTYDFIPNFPSTGVTLVDIDIFLPPDLILLQGWRIATSTTLLQAGDNFGAPQMLIEEWIEE